MKKVYCFIVCVIVTINLCADDTFYFPTYSPDSTAFFSSEMRNALAVKSKWNFYATVFENMYGTTEDGQKYAGGIRGLTRIAGSIGAIIPVWDYLSIAAHFTAVLDNADTAQSVNFFTGSGLLGTVSVFSLGLFGGYYSNEYTNYRLVYNDQWGPIDGYWSWEEDSKTTVSNARFAIAPQVGLANYIFFIDEIGGYFDFNADFDIKQMFAKIAFTALRVGASRLGINLYFKQEPYNIIVDQQLIGASFETNYIKVDCGYRTFINFTDTDIYQDGVYGRVIGKIPIGKHRLIVSAGIERTIHWIPTVGIGYSLDGGMLQALIEGGYNYGFGFNGFLHMDSARAFN